MSKTINQQSGTISLMNEIVSEMPPAFDAKKSAKKISQFNARMDELSEEMAAYFNERVTPGNLAEWNTSMFETCLAFPNETTGKHNPLNFLYSVGWDVLPALINAAPRNRVATLKEKLIWLYECESYQCTKESLCEINNRYSKSMKKYGVEDGERLYKHMTIYGVFQYALNCYQEYELLKRLRAIHEQVSQAA
jgi:hypothetical protein